MCRCGNSKFYLVIPSFALLLECLETCSYVLREKHDRCRGILLSDLFSSKGSICHPVYPFPQYSSFGLSECCLFVCKYNYAERSSAGDKNILMFFRCRIIKIMQFYAELRMQRIYTTLYCILTLSCQNCLS